MNAVAVTEPDYGSDVAGVKVAATKVDGGYLINGVKTWCTFGARADVLMVLARTDPLDEVLQHRLIPPDLFQDSRQSGGERVALVLPDGPLHQGDRAHRSGQVVVEVGAQRAGAHGPFSAAALRACDR